MTKLAFRIFIACLIVCVVMLLTGIWIGEHVLPEEYFKTMATFFVIGLASFLVWFSRTLLAIRESRENK